MGYKKFFLIMVVTAILGSATALITPIFLQLWSNTQEGLTERKIALIIVILFVSVLINLFFTFFRERFAKHFNQKNLATLTKSILSMKYDVIIKEGSVNLFEKAVQAVNNIYSYLTGDAIQIWSSTFVGAVSLALLAGVSLPVALVLTIAVPLNVLGYRILNKELAKRSKIMQKETGEGFQKIISRIQQVDYLKQSPTVQPLVESLDAITDRIYGSMAQVNAFAQSGSLVLTGLNDILRNFALIYIVFIFIQKKLDPSAIVLSSILLPLYFSCIGTITKANLRRTEYDTSMAFQQSLQDRKEDDGTQNLTGVDSIEMDVTKLMVPGREIIFNAVGNLKKGDIARVIGPSGSGKSTFAKGILKFRPVENIKVGGIPLSSVTNVSIRHHVEYLSQNVAIIRGTLRDNLFFNQKYCKDKEIRLIKEPILSTILATKSMDSEILIDGANLSGGEKQKIALARALNTNAEVLILDEICSSIDQETANEIYDRIREGREGRITIIVSHDNLPEGLVNLYLNQPILD